jgi:hypothetical protein
VVLLKESGFKLVLGHDAASDEVIYHDPSGGEYQRMKRPRFLELAQEPWVPLEVRRLVARPAERHAALARHVRGVREKMPAGFTLLLEPPFVVLGDGGERQVKRFAVSTVRWAVTHSRSSTSRRTRKKS